MAAIMQPKSCRWAGSSLTEEPEKETPSKRVLLRRLSPWMTVCMSQAAPSEDQQQGLQTWAEQHFLVQGDNHEEEAKGTCRHWPWHHSTTGAKPAASFLTCEKIRSQLEYNQTFIQLSANQTWRSRVQCAELCFWKLLRTQLISHVLVERK